MTWPKHTFGKELPLKHHLVPCPNPIRPVPKRTAQGTPAGITANGASSADCIAQWWPTTARVPIAILWGVLRWAAPWLVCQSHPSNLVPKNPILCSPECVNPQENLVSGMALFHGLWSLQVGSANVPVTLHHGSQSEDHRYVSLQT